MSLLPRTVGVWYVSYVSPEMEISGSSLTLSQPPVPPIVGYFMVDVVGVEDNTLLGDKREGVQNSLRSYNKK